MLTNTASARCAWPIGDADALLGVGIVVDQQQQLLLLLVLDQLAEVSPQPSATWLSCASSCIRAGVAQAERAEHAK